jgi:hypothetical protein
MYFPWFNVLKYSLPHIEEKYYFKQQQVNEDSYYLKSNSALWDFDDCLENSNGFIISPRAMN